MERFAVISVSCAVVRISAEEALRYKLSQCLLATSKNPASGNSLLSRYPWIDFN
jgi:hypothetical protein